MATVGLVYCDIIRGKGQQPKPRVTVWETPGVNGYGAHLTGYGSSPFRMTLVRYGVHATVAAWATSIQALQGQLVTITDNYGDVWPNMLIVEVGTPDERVALHAGGSRAQIEISGVMQP